MLKNISPVLVDPGENESYQLERRLTRRNLRIRRYPGRHVELANEWHQNLIESAAEASEELMEKYLGGEELTEAEIKGALRQRVLTTKSSW